MIEVSQIHKNFGVIEVLRGVDLSLKSGTCTSLIGPNASGKTTLLKMILGMVKPTSGRILVNNMNVQEDHKYREHVGYMPQIGSYPDNMKVGQLFSLLQRLRHSPDGFDEELVEAFRIREIENKTMASLSGGTRQKVSAALAFMFRSNIMILDEPTAGLDPLSAEILKEKIRKERHSARLFILTSHILSDLEEVSTHVVYLDDGKVGVFNTVSELLASTGKGNLQKAIAELMRTKEE